MQHHQKTILSHIFRGLLIATLICTTYATPVIASDSGIIVWSNPTDSYYIDDEDLYFSGINTASNETYFYIQSRDYSFQEIIVDNTILSTKVSSNNGWEVTVPNEAIKSMNLHTGTYVLYAVSDKMSVISTSSLDNYIYSSILITLKKFPLNITQIPDSITQGNTLTIDGYSYHSTYVQYYIFGSNHFSYGTVKTETNVDGEIVFEVNIEIDDTFTQGEYFVVIQGQYGDGKFSICPSGTDIVEKIYPSKEEIPLFDVSNMHPRSAAQALTENINMRGDDTCLTETFTVISAPKQDPIIPEQQETPDYTYDPSNGEEDTTPITQEPNYEVPETTERNPVIEAPSDTVTEDPLPPIEGINHELGNMDASTSTPFPYLSILAAISCIGLIIRRK
ncbi:MAG: hypothetical protein E7Z71_00350 [Methanocorpusculum parvum]|nr:hypothetical protein [Methanocorpusculum parvum]